MCAGGLLPKEKKWGRRVGKDGSVTAFCLFVINEGDAVLPPLPLNDLLSTCPSSLLPFPNISTPTPHSFILPEPPIFLGGGGGGGDCGIRLKGAKR